ncbi:MAG: GAF domain-containing protein [Deltaproteobacteria bacterium]|nr:MAG: GAF domain-containing protein [Deltaproteobacteria bacterium]
MELSVARIDELITKIRGFGKENLAEILHALGEMVPLITRQSRCRLYLEDLTSGTLNCVLATGRQAAAARQHAFPLTDPDFLVSRVFISQETASFEDPAELPRQAREVAERFSIQASYQLPLLHRGRAVGVLCIDGSRRAQLPDQPRRRALRQFLTEVVPVLDQARKHHQQLVLARRIDEAKKTEAARTMVHSAVRLIDHLSLASVLVPPRSGQGLEVLAAYAEDRKIQQLYEQEGLVDLEAGRSLLSRYIRSDGVIVDDTLLSPLYIPDLRSEVLQKRFLTEAIGLTSLYVVPRYDPATRRVICLVNYFTLEPYEFNEFERGLLEAHAEMAQRVIQEIGDEHVEIQVLSEINDLLQKSFEGVKPFLNRVLAKATELIGADTGSIALVQERDGEPWLLVEEPDGTLVGAKSKEWLKKNIPPIRVGGSELPRQMRSLSGYAAYSRQPCVVADTLVEAAGDGYYLLVTEAIRSEIAVPVCDGDQVLAVICLSSHTPRFFTEEHQRILQIIVQMIAQHLAGLLQIERLTGEVQRLRSDVTYRDPKISSYRLGNVIGNSAKAREIINSVETISPPLFSRIMMWQRNDLREAALGLPTILITGDTGSGKEFLFNNIYSRLNELFREQVGPHAELPVTKSNIAAYSGELTYSELFGHKRGAFTGAHLDRRGILEEANGGVVFLDEIGDADPKTQVQLLRFLDNGGFVRLGENQTRYARVLLVAATNRDLRRQIQAGLFREDLFHRLSELTIDVPSLNERREDIPDLAVHFLGQLYRIYRRTSEPADQVPVISREAQDLLAGHDYTGNIRELRSILLRALLFRRGRALTAEDVRRAITGVGSAPAPLPAFAAATPPELRLLDALRTGEGDFWTLVHQPFTEKQLTKDTVRALVAAVRRTGSRNMPEIATALKACDPRSSDAEEQRRFYKFKNFLYKTVKV